MGRTGGPCANGKTDRSRNDLVIGPAHEAGGDHAARVEIGMGSRPVSRVLSRTAIHLGRASPRASSDLPGNCAGHTSFPYLVLLRVGFTSLPMLPPARCALTAPFHPYPRSLATRAVFFLLHLPSARAAQALPGTLPYGARTFLRPAGQRLSGRLPMPDRTTHCLPAQGRNPRKRLMRKETEIPIPPQRLPTSHRPPRTTKTAKTTTIHSAILRPNRRQWTSAHSPDPRSTRSTTFCHGKTSSM